MSVSFDRGRVWAVLGPTNTGKTHLAVERMLGYPSGMMGFPLRLLARENYERVVRAKGPERVALITGEEKIIPADPAYFLCTVESMPVGRPVDFMAIDEVQLCADPDRGHVFTDRVLHARGREETLFLGAATMEPILRRLLPDCLFETRPRFSKLTYAGPRKLTRLPRRSAIVAFSANDVYAIAELVRRQRGGAAVVMGALSPRTRNAQVALYQNGEVDYLVATDAIGMGLNMDVDHVAFAAMEKFDGDRHRPLYSTEVAQIAGRAGRYQTDGTFGTTADVGPLPTDLVDRVEGHTFQAVRSVYWRNTALDMSSVAALMNSLNHPPGLEVLRRTHDAPDQMALEALTRDETIRSLARGADAVRLLWDVCRIPDFRKIHAASHYRLQSQIYHHLTSRIGRLPPDWIAGHIKRLDSTDGDILTLTDRIASIRVWTYIAHQTAWLADAAPWRERTRALEDRLSDALHDRLTQRFVDRRTAVLMKRLNDHATLYARVESDGAVSVEGHPVGRLEGFTFTPERGAGKVGDKALLNAALKALNSEMIHRVAALEAADNDAFSLADDGTVLWRGDPVARLTKGPEPLRPMIDVPVSDLLTGEASQRVRTRLTTWIHHVIAHDLAALMATRAAEGLSGPARGIAYQVTEALGTVRYDAVAPQLHALTRADRKALARLNVRLGVESVYMPPLLKPAAQRLRALLWSAYTGRVLALPPPGRVSYPVAVASAAPSAEPVGEGRSGTADRPDEAGLRALGFRLLGTRAVRADMLERFAVGLRQSLRDHATDPGAPKVGAPLPAHLPSMLGVSLDEAEVLCRILGYRVWRDESGTVHVRAVRRPRDPGQKRSQKQKQKQKQGQRPNQKKAAAGTGAGESATATEAAKAVQPSTARAPGETKGDHHRRIARATHRPSDSPFAVLMGKIRA